MRVGTAVAVSVLAALPLGGCRKPRMTRTAGSASVGVAPPAPSAAPERCTPAYAVLDRIPNATEAGPRWAVVRQVALANTRLLRVLPTAEHGGFRHDVAFIEVGRAAENLLVAKCDHRSTCSELGAAYAAVVRTAHPEVGCEAPGPGTPLDLLPMKGTRPTVALDELLPVQSDVQGCCARLAACRAVVGGQLDEPGVILTECRRTPARFRLSCAGEKACPDVVRCLEK